MMVGPESGAEAVATLKARALHAADTSENKLGGMMRSILDHVLYWSASWHCNLTMISNLVSKVIRSVCALLDTTHPAWPLETYSVVAMEVISVAVASP